MVAFKGAKCVRVGKGNLTGTEGNNILGFEVVVTSVSVSRVGFSPAIIGSSSYTRKYFERVFDLSSAVVIGGE